MKQKINPFLSASIFYILGNGIGQGLILVGTVIFTRIMAQEDFGEYSTYYSLVSILTSLVGANLFISLNNAYIDYKEKIYEYRASVLSLSSIVFAVLCGIIMALKYFIKIDLTLFMIFMALIHAYAFFVVNYFSYSVNMENRYKIKTLFLILPNALQIVLSVIFIVISNKSDLNARIAGSTLGVVICAVLVYWYMIHGKYKLFVPEFWKYGLKISVPSVFSSISYMIMQQSDKIMITKFYNASETAVYSLVYNIGYILYALWQATGSIFQVWIYHALDKNDVKDVNKILKWYLFIFMFFAFGILMVAPEMIMILAPEPYWEFNYISPFVLASCLMVMYGIYTNVGLFYKESTKVSICVSISAIINIGLNYVLIPVYGGVAAAYTSVIAYIVLFVLSRNLVEKHYKGLFSLRYFILFIVAVFIGCIIFSITCENIILRYAIFSVILLTCMVYSLRKKEEWLIFVKKEN